MRVLWLLLIGVICFQFANAADLVIYADYKNEPKIYQNDDGKADGILADILTEVTKRSGLTFEYRFYPWARAYRSAISDENGGIIGLSYTSERSKIIDYSEPMFIDEMVIFTKKTGYFDYQDINSLKGKTVAVKIGVSYGDDYEAAIKDKIFKIESVNNRLSQFRMLALERVDAILIGPSAQTGWSLINQSTDLRRAKADFVVLEQPFKADPNYLGIPKALKKTALIKQLDKHFIAIRQDGTLNAILVENLTSSAD